MKINTGFFLIVLALTGLMLSTPASAQTETVLHNFTTASGILPYSGVVFDAHGNLYGTAINGGWNDSGVVYQLSPSGDGNWTYSVLHNFRFGVANDGYYPESVPIFDSAGNLYGTSVWGGANADGIAYEMVPQADGSWNWKLIHSFNGTDGEFITAGLTWDATGNLYGTTTYGGSTYGSVCIGPAESGCGVVYQLEPDAKGGWVEHVLWNFSQNGADGYNPYGGVVFDAAGNLYGTTLYGGAYNYGIVYELSPTANGAWKETVLHSFDRNGTDGFYPNTGNLVLDTEGNLYGATADGGGGNYFEGTIFELSPSSGGTWTETIIQRFKVKGATGTIPNGSLIFDASGNLYGTTEDGGSNDNGLVFELSPNTNGEWTMKVLYNFDLVTDGVSPIDGVVFDNAGNLYGATQLGGTGYDFAQCGHLNCGTVFEVTP